MSRFDNYPGAPYTPYDDCPPDDICANCGAQLPDDPQEGTVEYEGFCSQECMDGKPGLDQWTPDLDAYGHLTWTVGDSDWIACFDVDVSPCGRFYAYEVVVDCDSGGFTDTPESGRGPIEEIDTLKGLADYWLGIYENHEPDPDVDPDPDGNARTVDCWSAHIDDCKRIAQSRRAA